jgi:hypothetical protein
MQASGYYTLFAGAGTDQENKQRRRVWGDAVAQLAIAYHQQVLLDFECFQEVFLNHTAVTTATEDIQ